jgi:hypothetical protein
VDVEESQKKNLEPLEPALDRIAALTDSKGIATLVSELAAAGETTGLFALDVEPSPEDSQKPISSLWGANSQIISRGAIREQSCTAGHPW